MLDLILAAFGAVSLILIILGIAGILSHFVGKD